MYNGKHVSLSQMCVSNYKYPIRLPINELYLNGEHMVAPQASPSSPWALVRMVRQRQRVEGPLLREKQE